MGFIKFRVLPYHYITNTFDIRMQRYRDLKSWNLSWPVPLWCIWHTISTHWKVEIWADQFLYIWCIWRTISTHWKVDLSWPVPLWCIWRTISTHWKVDLLYRSSNKVSEHQQQIVNPLASDFYCICCFNVFFSVFLLSVCKVWSI